MASVPSASAASCLPGTTVCVELAPNGTGIQVSLEPKFPLPVLYELWQVSICPLGDTGAGDQSYPSCDGDDLLVPLAMLTAPGADPCNAFDETLIGCIPQAKQDLYGYDAFDNYCLKPAIVRLWYNNAPPASPDVQVPYGATLTSGAC